MRHLETFLKLTFLIGSIYFLATRAVISNDFIFFMFLCTILGTILTFNKEASYNFKQTPRDLFIRKIEGMLLLAFPAIVYLMQIQ